MINRNDLTDLQLCCLSTLQAACHEHDKITLNFPVEEADSRYLFYMKDGQLVSALSLYFSGPETCECIAMTLPTFRKQGYFSLLLDEACEWLEEWETPSNTSMGSDHDTEAVSDMDLCFLTDHHCAAADAVLEHLGAELWYDEYMMEILLSPGNLPVTGKTDMNHTGTDSPGTDSPNTDGSVTSTDVKPHKLYILHDSERADHYAILHDHIGKIQIGEFYLHISNSHGYFYGFEIQEHLRGQGYGTSSMKAVMNWISSQHEFFIYKKQHFTLSLQVSSENPAALHLYKKTGFHVTETLSYYLY